MAQVWRRAVGVLVGGPVLAAICLSPLSAEAKTLYVNGTSGNDATSYAANGPTTPWRTIGRAAWGSTTRSAPNSAEAARAGDVVLISAGTYTTVGLNNRWNVAYIPANSGTAGNPITFQAVGTVTLTYSSGSGPLIGSSPYAVGSHLRNYITWRGFTINEASANYSPDTGPVVCVDSHHCVFENLTLIGRNSGTVAGDNYNGIRLERAMDVEIRNCTIQGFGRSGGDATNHTGITTYYSGRLLIENNQFVGNGTGIYLKANFRDSGPPYDFGPITVRLNIFRDNVTGVSFHRTPSTASGPTFVYQNLFVNNSEFAFRFKAFDSGTSDPRNGKVFNNTFVNNGSAVAALMHTVENSGNLVQNNIIVGTSGQVATAYRPENDTNNPSYTSTRLQWLRNLAFGPSVYGIFNGRNYSLADWKTATGQDAASVNTNPAFLNAATGDYRLSAASPARTLGRAIYGVGGSDGATIPAGAYITGNEIIGPSTGASNGPTPTPTPAAPTNLRIVPQP